MKRKARIQSGVDDRLVAIYARKSRITNKGDSIGVQFKQSADYAINQLSLPEDYDFGAHQELVPMQPGDVPVTYADTSALERDFGYKPSTSLREGLRKFAEWYAKFYK